MFNLRTEPGPWTLDPGPWTLASGLQTLDSGLWTASLEKFSQNMQDSQMQNIPFLTFSTARKQACISGVLFHVHSREERVRGRNSLQSSVTRPTILPNSAKKRKWLKAMRKLISCIYLRHPPKPCQPPSLHIYTIQNIYKKQSQGSRVQSPQSKVQSPVQVLTYTAVLTEYRRNPISNVTHWLVFPDAAVIR